MKNHSSVYLSELSELTFTFNDVTISLKKNHSHISHAKAKTGTSCCDCDTDSYFQNHESLSLNHCWMILWREESHTNLHCAPKRVSFCTLGGGEGGEQLDDIIILYYIILVLSDYTKCLIAMNKWSNFVISQRHTLKSHRDTQNQSQNPEVVPKLFSQGIVQLHI